MAGKLYEAHKSSIGGMDANVMMLICYLASVVLGFIPFVSYVAWVAPLVLFFLEKNSEFVRFHAMQSFVINLIGQIIALLLNLIANLLVGSATSLSGLGIGLMITGIFSFISLVVSIVILVFEIIAIVKGWKYEAYKIPVIGGITEKIAAIMPKITISK